MYVSANVHYREGTDMTYPQIGEAWRPKRGRRDLTPVTIRNIYRADHSVLVTHGNGRTGVLPVRDLRRDYKPGAPR